MNSRLLACAAIYAVIGIAIGFYMGMADDFALRDVHAHANLVGWVSMAVIAFAYRLYPGLEWSRLAAAQFWLHNLGLPVMLVGLAGIGYGKEFGIPVTSIGSILVALAFLCFVTNCLRNISLNKRLERGVADKHAGGAFSDIV